MVRCAMSYYAEQISGEGEGGTRREVAVPVASLTPTSVSILLSFEFMTYVMASEEI